MPIYMTARFQVRPESVEKVRQAVRDFIDHIRANEPGTGLYVSLEDSKDPTRFLHVFWFTGEDAQQTHRTSEAVDRFTSILYPETVGGVEFTTYDLVASTTEHAEDSPWQTSST
jgi:quinol monooxygenase YgiN